MKLILNHPDMPRHWAVSEDLRWFVRRKDTRQGGKVRYMVEFDDGKQRNYFSREIQETWLLDFLRSMSIMSKSKEVGLYELTDDGKLKLIIEHVACVQHELFRRRIAA